jgi:MFS family permease
MVSIAARRSAVGGVHVGAGVDCVSSGMISDALLARTGSRRIARQGLSVAGVVLAALFIFAAWFVKGPVAAVLVISAGSFCAAFAGPTSYALSIEMGGKHVSAVFGAMNMSGSIGALVFPVVVGYILELTGNWEAILLLFAGIYVAAAFFWLLFDPNGTVFDKPHRDLPSH